MMNKQDVIEAMKLIIAKSPDAYREASKTILAANNNSPVLQIRVNNVVKIAFNDPQAEFDGDEREFLASVMAGQETGNKPTSIRFTDEQRLVIQDAADRMEISFSAFVVMAAMEKAKKV